MRIMYIMTAQGAPQLLLAVRMQSQSYLELFYVYYIEI